MEIIKRTGRKMDAAWRQAISEGLKASSKIGHSIKTSANNSGLSNAIARGALKTAASIGGKTNQVKSVIKDMPEAIKLVVKKPTLKNVKEVSRVVRLKSKVAGSAGRISGFAKAANGLDKAGFRSGLTGKMKIK